MAEGHVRGQHNYSVRTYLKPGNAVSCILSIQICSKLILTILVYEIKDGKNAQKIINNIYHYLVLDKPNNLCPVN
jgi:hypothetical protein